MDKQFTINVFRMARCHSRGALAEWIHRGKTGMNDADFASVSVGCFAGMIFRINEHLSEMEANTKEW